ncbi:MAG: putative peptidoglycan glycosyltransferase FtsW [Deltaproteobacteria bacterium]
MTEMVHGSVPVRDSEPLLQKWWRTLDHWSLSAVLLLFGIGILMALAASPPLAEKNGLPQFHYVWKQAEFGALALIAMLATTMMPPKLVRRLGVLGFVGAFIGLAMLPVLGTDFGKGAIRWYSLGFASIQPSEFLKPGFIVMTAWLLASAMEINGPAGKTYSFVMTVMIVTMLALQPDFGQASLFLFGWGVMYFIAGAPMLLLFVMAVIVPLAGTFAYHNSEHLARRIDGFLSPDVDPRTQIGYATNAIQEGGLFGTGLGGGEVKWVLPDAHTDFIIAVAAEEWGLALVLLIIFLFLVISVRSLMRLAKERDPFIRIAGSGLAAMFAIQAVINMGVAVRLLPAKGMTLPFVSYGGSSLIATGIMVGMLLSFTRARPQDTMGRILRKSL